MIALQSPFSLLHPPKQPRTSTRLHARCTSSVAASSASSLPPAPRQISYACPMILFPYDVMQPKVVDRRSDATNAAAQLGGSSRVVPEDGGEEQRGVAMYDVIVEDGFRGMSCWVDFEGMEKKDEELILSS